MEQQDERREKRRHPRIECMGAAEVYLSPDKPPCAARVTNLSLEGGLIVLSEPQSVACGAVVELAFNVNKLPLRVRAKVKMVRSETILGLHFDLLSARGREHLAELILELAKSNVKRDAEAKDRAKLKARMAGCRA